MPKVELPKGWTQQPTVVKGGRAKVRVFKHVATGQTVGFSVFYYPTRKDAIRALIEQNGD